jgi:hemerythrin-like metal-binding protein
VYVIEHFSTEEKLLLEINYPGYAAQKREHAYFIKRLLEEADRFDQGDNWAPSRFVSFLADWLVSHIATEDKKYAVYFQGNKPA